MRASLAILVLVLCVPSAVRADSETPLRTLGELKAACQEARDPGRRALYVVQLSRFRFARASEDGFLPIDTRRNLPAFGGSAALFPSDLESIGFRASEARQRALREARRAGASLRVGFFLGFDGEGQPCVIRPAVSVSTIRMDVGFVELVDSRGRVLARDDTERLRAWRDDLEREAVPGEGPRVAVEEPWSRSGTVPAGVTEALRALAPRLGRCHEAHVRRGGAEAGRVLIQIELVGGSVREPTIAFTTLPDEALGQCLLREVARAALPPVSATLPLPLRLVTR